MTTCSTLSVNDATMSLAMTAQDHLQDDNDNDGNTSMVAQ